jgi:uncharacterized protein YdaU (DUF1376 family)
MHYYPHHIGDFTKDTYFLNNEEIGIVIRLLGLYYDAEEPFQNDISLLSVKVNAQGKEEIVKKILGLIFKYDEKENIWKQNRCDKEIEHYHSLIAIRKKGGEESAKKRKKEKELWFSSSSTQALLTKNQEPISINQDLISIIHDPVVMERDEVEFQEFYSIYPKKAKRAEGFEMWKKLRPNIELVKKAISWQLQDRNALGCDSRYIPSISNWLLHRRWEDERVLDPEVPF